MGAAMTMDGSSMKLATDGKPLQGVNIYMDTVSVGATINTILAAVKAEGRTVIENAAREPEIIDVVTLLNNMGAHIRGAGTDIIIIDGVPEFAWNETSSNSRSHRSRNLYCPCSCYWRRYPDQ